MIAGSPGPASVPSGTIKSGDFVVERSGFQMVPEALSLER